MRGRLSTEALVWFGAGGGAAAWVLQLVLGAEVEETHCTPVGERWGVETLTWEIALTAGCGVVALAAGAAAVVAYRQTRRRRDRRGRIVFMATGGILADGLFLALILLGGIGASVLERCVQA
jgi:hypothetical protein